MPEKIPGSGAGPGRIAHETGGSNAPHKITTTINLFSYVSGEISLKSSHLNSEISHSINSVRNKSVTLVVIRFK